MKVNHAVEGSIDEHIRALGLQGSNDLENRSIWRKPCSDAKTYKIDLPTIAKAKRQSGETKTRVKKTIPSRAFDKPKDGYNWPKRSFEKRKK